MNSPLNSFNVPGAPDADALSESQNLTMRLLELCKRTNYELVQENGQRRLTSPDIAKGLKKRIKGAEIFLGRLPRDCYEDEIYPVMERVGRVLELRLMLDFSGSTRGYCFVLYENSQTARRACQILNKYEIRKGCEIGVVKSRDNCRLFFGGVPKDKTREEFLEKLRKMLDGITDIYLYPNAENKALNRGFMFVEFKDHRSAAMARRQLVPGKINLWDHEVAVDWADPEPGEPMDDDLMETVSALFVRNLDLKTSQQKLKETFQKMTGIPILKLKKINHFAFIHYENRLMAQKVMSIMTKPGTIAQFEKWEISWAKPIGGCKVLERQQCIYEAMNLCKSNNNNNCYQKDNNINSNNNNGINNFSCNKTIDHKKIKKRYVPQISASSTPTKIDYALILQQFVQNTFQGRCSFYSESTSDSRGFFCKIIITIGSSRYEFKGSVQTTEQKAVNIASRNAYHKLSGSIPAPIKNNQPPQFMNTELPIMPRLDQNYQVQPYSPWNSPLPSLNAA